MNHVHELYDNKSSILPFFLDIIWKKQQGVLLIFLGTQKSLFSPVLEMGSNERTRHPHCSISIHVDGLILFVSKFVTVIFSSLSTTYSGNALCAS